MLTRHADRIAGVTEPVLIWRTHYGCARPRLHRVEESPARESVERNRFRIAARALQAMRLVWNFLKSCVLPSFRS
jgi:hypothetical protein